jgi:hypothetical protein
MYISSWHSFLGLSRLEAYKGGEEPCSEYRISACLLPTCEALLLSWHLRPYGLYPTFRLPILYSWRCTSLLTLPLPISTSPRRDRHNSQSPMALAETLPGGTITMWSSALSPPEVSHVSCGLFQRTRLVAGVYRHGLRHQTDW